MPVYLPPAPTLQRDDARSRRVDAINALARRICHWPIYQALAETSFRLMRVEPGQAPSARRADIPCRHVYMIGPPRSLSRYRRSKRQADMHCSMPRFIVLCLADFCAISRNARIYQRRQCYLCLFAPIPSAETHRYIAARIILIASASALTTRRRGTTACRAPLIRARSRLAVAARDATPRVDGPQADRVTRRKRRTGGFAIGNLKRPRCTRHEMKMSPRPLSFVLPRISDSDEADTTSRYDHDVKSPG
jgi:hypothetical protein